jgi:NAD(P)-dependent dehydrogenase (short-subunit alcohol dehydrogenase family)
VLLYVSSIAGYGPMQTVLDYGPAKWGVRALFKNTRDLPGLLGEDKPQLRVNLIAPSWVRTPMTERFIERLEQAGCKVANVSDVVHVVLRMCVDEAVQGRAAAILPDKASFDLGDDAAGMGASQELLEAKKRDVFGYFAARKAAEDGGKKQDAGAMDA